MRAHWRRQVSPGAEDKAEVLVRKLADGGLTASLDLDSSTIELQLDLDEGADADRAAEEQLDAVSADWRRWLFVAD
jgi:hypothetical protein